MEALNQNSIHHQSMSGDERNILSKNNIKSKKHQREYPLQKEKKTSMFRNALETQNSLNLF